jgi:hypothetical protein
LAVAFDSARNAEDMGARDGVPPAGRGLYITDADGLPMEAKAMVDYEG